MFQAPVAAAQAASWETHVFLIGIPLLFVAIAVLAFARSRGGRREH